MSLHGTYDPNNIFAKIIRGEAPCYRLFEDELTLAFLDVFPQSLGHSLVIPKKTAARTLLDMDSKTLGHLMCVVQRLTKVLIDELAPDGVQLAQFNGAPAGQTVFHLHMHIIPRYQVEQMKAHGNHKTDPKALQDLQSRLQQRLERTHY